MLRFNRNRCNFLWSFLPILKSQQVKIAQEYFFRNCVYSIIAVFQQACPQGMRLDTEPPPTRETTIFTPFSQLLYVPCCKSLVPQNTYACLPQSKSEPIFRFQTKSSTLIIFNGDLSSTNLHQNNTQILVGQQND